MLFTAQKTTNEEILIDTVVLPKQTCTNIWVEDKGIEEKSTIEFLREHFITKKKEVFAWVHTRSPGQNDCEFSSIDIHTQYALEKYVSKKIVGIVIQIRKDDYIWNAIHLNIFGTQRVEFCGKNFNKPVSEHKSCACECLHESYWSSIKLWDEIPFGKSKVLLGNYMSKMEHNKQRWDHACKPSDTESDIEDP